MKKDIHPNYVECQVTCACGNHFATRATVPEIKVGVLHGQEEPRRFRSRPPREVQQEVRRHELRSERRKFGLKRRGLCPVFFQPCCAPRRGVAA